MFAFCRKPQSPPWRWHFYFIFLCVPLVASFVEGRYLKGSSSSTSSGGGRSSGSSNSRTSIGADDGGGGGGGGGNSYLGMIAVVGIVIGLVWLCCRLKKAAYGQYQDVKQGMRQKVHVTARTTPVTFQKPTSGRYSASYYEGGRQLVTSVVFHFTRDYWGWQIHGQGKDNDGSFTISEGLVSPSGDMYWVESKNRRASIANESVSFGKYDFANIQFTGSWKASNGVEGDYGALVFQHEVGKTVDNIPPIIVHHFTKTSVDVNLGVNLQATTDGQVFLSYVEPGSPVGDSHLAAGMSIVSVNHQLVFTAEHALQVMRAAMPVVVMVSFRDGQVFDAALKLRLVSASIFKDPASSKIGIRFRKEQNILYIQDIQPGSQWTNTALRPGMKVWAINQHGSIFGKTQEAVDVIEQAGNGLVTLVAEDASMQKQQQHQPPHQIPTAPRHMLNIPVVEASAVDVEAEISVLPSHVKVSTLRLFLPAAASPEQAPPQSDKKAKKTKRKK